MVKKLFILLCLCCIGIGSAWGADVTFTSGTDTSSGTSITKSGVTLTATTFNNASYYQTYSGDTFKASVESGAITKIVFTCTANGSSKYGPGKYSTTTGTYTFEEASNIGTWTGNANSVSFSASAQVRMTSIVVTYTGGSSKTLTSIAISGTPNKITYEVGEEFDPAGLVVTGTYDDETQGEIKSGITWKANGQWPLNLTLGTENVIVAAIVQGITSATYPVAVTVKNPDGDKLTSASFGSPSSYTSWSGKKGSQGVAEYAGQSSGGNSYIQMRNQSPSGIVSTKSGGNIRKIKVDWNSSTTSSRSLKIYGSNIAYTASSELYSETNRGTELGTIAKGTTVLEITGDYAYVGVLPVGGALYLNSITFVWEEVSLTDPEVSFAKTSDEVGLLEGTYTQVVSTKSDGTVTYTSSNNEVATVNNSGVVTLLKEGTVTITASTARTDTYKEGSASYTLTITDNRGENVITFTEEAIIKHVGDESFINTYTATDETGDITFSSTNTGVATVGTDGTVTIVGNGTTTISVTIAASANYKEGQASYTLTVLPHTTGDGTISNPFTVSDVVTLNNTFSGNYWVKGIVSGYADSSLDNIKTKDFTSSNESNIVLAEGDNIIGVQLPSGAIRKALNLNAHPYLLNTEIYVYGSLEKYFSNNPGVKNTSNCAKVVTIASSGYSSFSSTYAVTIPEGITAYYATGVEGTKVSMIEFTGNVIPANTGAIIKGEASKSYTFVGTAEAGDAVEGNCLVAVLEAISGLAPEVTIDDVTYKNYVFTQGQFHPFTTGATVNVGAGKAYLRVVKPADPSAKLEMNFDGGTTGIDAIHSIQVNDNAIYNLRGERVNTMLKGNIYIVNGKKYLVK